jgi:sarcosine oxidase subunit alpha
MTEQEMNDRAGGPMRLGPQPGELIDRTRTVEFSWNGRPVTGYAGDTIVSALAAAGERVFSRSLKYHTARGRAHRVVPRSQLHGQVADRPTSGPPTG